MDADRPAQPDDPAEPTVVQRRPPAPDQAGQGEQADQADQPSTEDRSDRADETRPSPVVAPVEPPEAQQAPVRSEPARSGATEVLRKASAGEGATEVLRASKLPTPYAAPSGPPSPRPGDGGFGGPQQQPQHQPQHQPQQPGPGFGGPSTNPGFGAAPQPAAPYGGQYGPLGAYGQPRPTQTFDPGSGMPPPGPGGAPAGAPQPRHGKLIALIAAGVVLLAAVGVGGWFLLRPRYVDPELAKAEVVTVTQKTDELAATDVRCPTDAEQKHGGTFTCTATVVGKQITYTVQQSDDKGTAFTVRYDRPVLDPAAVQKQIAESTRTEIGVEPTDVNCPGDVHYDKNATFTCTAKLESQPLNYTITQTDGLGAVSVAHGRVLKNTEVAQKIADELTKQVGAPIVVQCGPAGQTVVVNEPGQQIECQASAVANPAKIVPIPVVVDRSGTVYPAS